MTEQEEAVMNDEAVVHDADGRLAAGIAYLCAAILLVLCVVIDPHSSDVWLSGIGAIALSGAALYQFRRLVR